MSFLQSLLRAALQAAITTSGNALQSNAGLKNTAISAGTGAAAGALIFVLSHPMAQHPEVRAAVQPVLDVKPAA